MAWLLGLMFLFPWNSILTIGDYYYAIFPDYHPSRVFTLIYQPLSLMTTLVFVCFEARVSTRLRVLVGYGSFFVLLLLFIIVDLATSGHGGVGPYVGVCALVSGLGIADGVAQGALVGDLSFMEPIYIQAYSAGLGMSGLITSALRFVTKATFEDSPSGIRKGVCKKSDFTVVEMNELSTIVCMRRCRKLYRLTAFIASVSSHAVTFFAISAFLELVGFLVYAVVFPKVQAVKQFRLVARQQGALTVKDDLAAAGLPSDHDSEIGKPTTRLTVWQLAARNWDYLLDQIIIYTVSLSIFPGFLYEDTGNHELGTWYALVLVAVYNAGDFGGCYLPLWRPLYLESRKLIFLLCVARVLFIPCFYFAAKYADAGWTIFLCIMLGTTSGYLSVLGFMRAPCGYSSPEQNAIGNILVLALILGLTLGVLSGWLWLIGKG